MSGLLTLPDPATIEATFAHCPRLVHTFEKPKSASTEKHVRDALDLEIEREYLMRKALGDVRSTAEIAEEFRGKILTLLKNNPSAVYTLTEVAKLCRMGTSSASRHMAWLFEQGMCHREKIQKGRGRKTWLFWHKAA